jgi:ribonuclease D
MTDVTPGQDLVGTKVSTMAYEMVTDDDTLNALCRKWQTCEFVAMDTEFIRTTTFYPHVGLIQVNDNGQTSYLIDPLTISDWHAFRDLMLDPAVTKIFHSCSEDMQVFMAAMQLVPTPVFDTQIGAAFLNTGFGISYQNLVNLCLGIDIPKGETRSDWLQRPLTETQCQYAALDVACLPEIYLAQREQLEQTGKLAWLQEECEALLQQYRNEMIGDYSSYYQNIKGAWQLNRAQLAILKELAQWRELRARKRDKPRNWIITDRNLLDIARLRPLQLDDLSDVEGLSRNFLHHEGSEILNLVASGVTMPEAGLPELLPKPPDGKAKARLKKGQQFIEKRALELALPVEILARKRWLISLVQDMPEQGSDAPGPALPAELNGWRNPLLLPGLLDAMR